MRVVILDNHLFFGILVSVIKLVPLRKSCFFCWCAVVALLCSLIRFYLYPIRLTLCLVNMKFDTFHMLTWNGFTICRFSCTNSCSSFRFEKACYPQVICTMFRFLSRSTRNNLSYLIQGKVKARVLSTLCGILLSMLLKETRK